MSFYCDTQSMSPGVNFCWRYCPSFVCYMQPYEQVLCYYATVAVRYVDGWNLFSPPTKCWCRVL